MSIIVNSSGISGKAFFSPEKALMIRLFFTLSHDYINLYTYLSLKRY